MKTVIALIIIILSLGIYMILTWGNNINHSPYGAQVKQGKGTGILIEEVDNALLHIPDVREINYFETLKDIDNWVVRSDEKNGIEVSRSDRYVSQGNYSMEINWKTQGWGDLFLVYFPEDWKEYRKFSFDIFNPNKNAIDFVIDIENRNEYFETMNKFSINTILKSGVNNFNLSIDAMKGKLNIDSEYPEGQRRKIIRFRFFTSNKKVYLDNMRIEQ